MLHRVSEVFSEITEAFENFQFFRFFQTVQNFCVVDLSSFYLDIAKDRLYISHSDSHRRRSCQTVIAIVLENLTKAIAPVLCHLAEDIWQYLPYQQPYKSVFESGWVNIQPQWQQQELLDSWNLLRQIRTEVNKVTELARAAKMIGSSLDSKVLIYVTNSEVKSLLSKFNTKNSLTGNRVDELRYLFLASFVEVLDSVEPIELSEYKTISDTLCVAIKKADGQKCDRCWNYSSTVGEFPDDPSLCDRCESALAGKF